MPKAKTRAPKRQAIPDPDYSLPRFNDPARLQEWMKVLSVTQSDLARKAGVAQQLISAIVTGKKPFSEPSRTKIWRAISRLNLDQNEEHAPKMWAGMEGKGLDNLKALLALGNLGFKTPMELKDEEIELLKRERDLAVEQRDTFKQLVDMNLVDLCAELGKKLADAHQQISDFHRLFALKGTSVAADELQEQIEERTKISSG